MFAAGVVVSFLLSQKIQKDMRKIVICVNAVAITLVALMPLTWDPIMTIYPMIFAASFQWGTFSEAQGYASATIFLSNNTKQSVLAWTQFFMTKDWKYFHKAILYTGTILSFMAGCLAAGFAVLREGVYGAFYGYALLVIAISLSIFPTGMAEQKRKRPWIGSKKWKKKKRCPYDGSSYFRAHLQKKGSIKRE